MEIRANIVILNESDEVLKRRGIIDEVRKVEVEALVDTGAVMMLIPQDMKDHLGLEDEVMSMINTPQIHADSSADLRR